MHAGAPAAAGLTLRSALVLAALQGRGVTRPYTPSLATRRRARASPRAWSRTRSALRRTTSGSTGTSRSRTGSRSSSRATRRRTKRRPRSKFARAHFSDPDDAGAGALCRACSSSGRSPSRRRARSRSFSPQHGGQSNAFSGDGGDGLPPSVQHTQLPFGAGALRLLLRRAAAAAAEDSCAREMKAIDSEYRRNLQTDARRVFQLMKTTAAAGHLFTKFSTGNLETLSVGEPPRGGPRLCRARIHRRPDAPGGGGARVARRATVARRRALWRAAHRRARRRGRHPFEASARRVGWQRRALRRTACGQSCARCPCARAACSG